MSFPGYIAEALPVVVPALLVTRGLIGLQTRGRWTLSGEPAPARRSERREDPGARLDRWQTALGRAGRGLAGAAPARSG